MKLTQARYNEMMQLFDDYGNRNYSDTVENTLPAFFLHYDTKFAPTEHIITMDYPVFGLDVELDGIDRIARYVDAIWMEQLYLKKFPRKYVIDELLVFHPSYENEFFNIREILELQMKED